MCLLLFYLNPTASADEYYLILINVRDEIYDRPTKLAHFWGQHLDIIGGIDIEPGKEGGTWFAMSKTGKLAALLNILQPDDEIQANKKGRGFLVVDYVTGSEDCLKYLDTIQTEKDSYNGFTLVTMDFSSFKSPKVAYFSNFSSLSPTVVQPGVHAFGNSTSVECPWPKVKNAKEMFSKIVENHSSTASKDVLVESLFKFLRDSTCYTLDENMKKQGRNKSSNFMDKLSSIFVHIPESNYGSRSHTIVLIDGLGKVDYFESSRSEHNGSDWKLQQFSYQLISKDHSS